MRKILRIDNVKLAVLILFYFILKWTCIFLHREQWGYYEWLQFWALNQNHTHRHTNMHSHTYAPPHIHTYLYMCVCVDITKTVLGNGEFIHEHHKYKRSINDIKHSVFIYIANYIINTYIYIYIYIYIYMYVCV